MFNNDQFSCLIEKKNSLTWQKSQIIHYVTTMCNFFDKTDPFGKLSIANIKTKNSSISMLALRYYANCLLSYCHVLHWNKVQNGVIRNYTNLVILLVSHFTLSTHCPVPLYTSDDILATDFNTFSMLSDSCH